LSVRSSAFGKEQPITDYLLPQREGEDKGAVELGTLTSIPLPEGEEIGRYRIRWGCRRSRPDRCERFTYQANWCASLNTSRSSTLVMLQFSWDEHVTRTRPSRPACACTCSWPEKYR